jgi:hypothetical protein
MTIRRMLADPIAALLALASTAARATIIYGDGLAHSVSTALGDSVIVRGGSLLSVLPGAAIGDFRAPAALLAAWSGPVTTSGGSSVASGGPHIALQYGPDAPLTITGGTFAGGTFASGPAFGAAPPATRSTTTPTARTRPG